MAAEDRYRKLDAGHDLRSDAFRPGGSALRKRRLLMPVANNGEVEIDIPHSTRRIIGRQASIDGVDGSQIYASVFFHS